MSFFNLRKVKKVLHIGGTGGEAKKKRVYNNIKIKFVSSPEVADFRDLVACHSLSTPRLVVKM